MVEVQDYTLFSSPENIMVAFFLVYLFFRILPLKVSRHRLLKYSPEKSLFPELWTKHQDQDNTDE
jgi:hypothetical protein